VLHAVSGEDFEAAVIELDGDIDGDLASGRAENFPHAVVEFQRIGSLIEPRGGGEPGICLLVYGDGGRHRFLLYGYGGRRGGQKHEKVVCFPFSAYNHGLSILSINVGSSTIKYSVFRHPDLQLLYNATEQGTDTEVMFSDLAARDLPAPIAIGHRIVHGGPDYFEPVRLTPQVRRDMGGVVHFAPLHMPQELKAIDAISAKHPELPQILCFDTAFHRNLPEVAKRFALPEDYWHRGIQRYGFHGLSYEYIVGEIGSQLGKRSIIAHLGNGASMVALLDLQPMDTTMGLTPAGGIMMGTRAGDLDPGIFVHIERLTGMSTDDFESLVNKKSGLLGVSGTTADMRKLEEAAPQDPKAALAIEMFCYIARKHIGALAAVLGGLDTLVFTAGIGENAKHVRERICEGLGYLRPRVIVQPTDEDLVIARHVLRAM
jgi:acetate kinase